MSRVRFSDNAIRRMLLVVVVVALVLMPNWDDSTLYPYAVMPSPAKTALSFVVYACDRPPRIDPPAAEVDTLQHDVIQSNQCE